MSRGKASKLIAQIKVILVAKTYSISEFWFTHSPCNLSKTSNAWKIFRLSTSTSGNQTWKYTKMFQKLNVLTLRISRKEFEFYLHSIEIRTKARITITILGKIDIFYVKSTSLNNKKLLNKQLIWRNFLFVIAFYSTFQHYLFSNSLVKPLLSRNFGEKSVRKFLQFSVKSTI